MIEAAVEVTGSDPSDRATPAIGIYEVVEVPVATAPPVPSGTEVLGTDSKETADLPVDRNNFATLAWVTVVPFAFAGGIVIALRIVRTTDS